MASNLIMSGVLNGNRDTMSAKIAGIRIARGSGVIVAVGFDDKTKLFAADVNVLWRRYMDLCRQLTSLGLSPRDVFVFGPYKNYVAVLRKLRDKLEFRKLPFVTAPLAGQTATEKMECVLCYPSNVQTALETLEAASMAVIDTAPANTVPVDIPVGEVMQNNQSNRAAKTITHNGGVESQYRHLCSINYPAPSVTLPRWDKKQLIRLRVRDFVMLKANKFFEPSSDDFHFAWKNMWQLFDMRTGNNLTRKHAAKEKTGYTGSILDLAEERGMLEEVYAFVMEEYYHMPDMPPVLAAPGADLPTHVLGTATPPSPTTIMDTLVDPMVPPEVAEQRAVSSLQAVANDIAAER